MCLPALGIAVVQGASIAANTYSAVQSYKESSANAKYQTQVAIANMKNSRNLAYQQNQEGIEEARKEKIEGIQKSKYYMAKAAASGFSTDSLTNLYNQEDIYNTYDSNANDIQKKYNARADAYMRQANSYLNQANIIESKARNDEKNKLYSIALAGLGKTSSVAKRWYGNGII